MTQPAPPQSQASQQLALQAAVILPESVTVAEAAAALNTYALAAGIRMGALLAALRITMQMPQPRLGASGSATLDMIRLNWLRRGQYLVAASGRMMHALADARSHGRPAIEALDAAMQTERRYWSQHVEADQLRMQAGARVDGAAAMYGPLLGWYTYRDGRTSPECLAADLHNFTAGIRPVIGYPGAVHPHCRCTPGAPHPGASLLPAPGRGRIAVA